MKKIIINYLIQVKTESENLLIKMKNFKRYVNELLLMMKPKLMESILYLMY